MNDNSLKNDEFLSSAPIKAVDNRRSELAQELISNKPDFWEKWALFIFVVILLCMLFATWFIRYPDIIEAPAVLTSMNAPKEIIPQQSGHLIRLFIHNDGQVEKNEAIAWIESTASHEEVLQLSRQIDKSILLLKGNNLNNISSSFNFNYTNLGEIQLSYQQFIIALQQFDDYTVNGFYRKKKLLLMNDIASLNETKANIKIQKRLTEIDVKLAEESFMMNKKLIDAKVITKEEFRQQTSKYVNKQLGIPQLNGEMVENETQQRSKFKDLQQLDHDQNQQKVIFEQMLQSLKSQVDDWIKKYVIQSPIRGKVYFTMPLQENQFLQSNKIIGYINPPESTFYAEANLSQNNFGKIDTGMEVQIRLQAYPYEETGFLPGKLNYISKVPTDSGFLATIKLQSGLITNNHKHIIYRSGLKGSAIIITKNMRLLQRLYYNIIKTASIK